MGNIDRFVGKRGASISNLIPPAFMFVRTTRFEGALQTRIVGRAESTSSPSWIAMLLEEGEAKFRSAETTEDIAAPNLVWRPWSGEHSVALAPGSVGTYILLGSAAMANAIGHKPESRALWEIVDTASTIPFASGDDSFAAQKNCFSAIHKENRAGRLASRLLIEAYLQIILLELWTSQLAPAAEFQRGSSSQRLFQEFVALAELHFRERWTVGRYASALGVTRDRLGDICRREHGLGPKELLDSRVSIEARQLVENSTYSVEQIAGRLGFQSASQFSRFFNRKAGAPPGRFRKDHIRNDDAPQTAAGLHEWP